MHDLRKAKWVICGQVGFLWPMVGFATSGFGGFYGQVGFCSAP